MNRLTWSNVQGRAGNVAVQMERQFQDHKGVLSLYPIPRGGVYACQSVLLAMSHNCVPRRVEIVEDPSAADAYVDDIIDSGKTREKVFNQYGVKPFYALVVKEKYDTWYEFPWERMVGESGPEQNVRRLLQYIGEDPDREGLRETPSRVVRSYNELFSGYEQNPADVMKVFEDGACDEMVIVKNIEVFSTCEHHMLPFFGKAHVAYVPDKKVLGVSKVVRLLEIFSRRLQIQERLCQQVTSALDQNLQPRGSACVIEAQHLCMTCRGVQKQNSVMVTSSLTGVFREKGEARSEFLSITRG